MKKFASTTWSRFTLYALLIHFTACKSEVKTEAKTNITVNKTENNIEVNEDTETNDDKSGKNSPHMASDENKETSKTENTNEDAVPAPLTAAITRHASQSVATNALPILFSINFSQAISPESFLVDDIEPSSQQTANNITWAISTVDTEGKIFTLSATSINGDGKVSPQLKANSVTPSQGNAASQLSQAIATGSDQGVYFDSTPPAAPVNLKITADSLEESAASFDDDLEFYMQWDGTLDTGLGLKDYSVSVYPTSDCSGTPSITENNTDRSKAHSGSPGSQYSFKVTAYDNVGNAGTSQCSSSIDLPIFFLNLNDVTFAPNMATRQTSAGPFDVGTLVQSEIEGEQPERIRIPGSYNITYNFRQVADSMMGTVIMWVTPQWNGNDNRKHSLFSTEQNHTLVYKREDNFLVFDAGWGNSVTQDISNWTAGSTYLVAARWDYLNTIDGTNHLSLSINNVHVFNESSLANAACVATCGANDIYIGSTNDDWDDDYPANAQISGFTLYRRVLFDGAYGIDVGFGNELDKIYNGGAGDDPAFITGSWDIVAAMPTNQIAGTLSSTTGHAWSHPHNSNLLGGTNGANGFMLQADYVTDGWSQKGSPASVSNLANSEKVFSGGYKVDSDDADEGIYRDIAVSPDDSWVIRVLAHSDGVSVPKAVLYDQSNMAVISELQGSNTSTRTAPDMLLFTAQAPAGCNTLRVKLVNSQNSGTVYWHQAEVLANDFSNPSFEVGSSDPWIPTDWDQFGTMEAGDSSQETNSSHIHSGSSAFRATPNAQFEWIGQELPRVAGAYYSLGVWAKHNSGDNADTFQSNHSRVERQYYNPGDNSTGHLRSVSSSTYTLSPAILRQDTVIGVLDFMGFGSRNSGDNHYDDAYSFRLDDLSLDLTVSNLAASTESGGLRVDGRDQATQPIAFLKNNWGSIQFSHQIRHDSAYAVAFSEGPRAYILTMHGDSDDFIKLYWSAANTITLEYSMNGSSDLASWNTGTDIAAETAYLFKINFLGGGSMQLFVNGNEKITLPSIPDSFGTVPVNAFWGSDESGANQSDSLFNDPF